MCMQNTTYKNKADSQGTQGFKSLNTLKKEDNAMFPEYLPQCSVFYLIFPM